MTDKVAINPERLKWCLREDEVTLEEVSKGSGIALGALERALDGKKAITFKQLDKIADYFYRGAMFFLRPEPIQPDTAQSLKFRTVGNKKMRMDIRVRVFIRRIQRLRKTYIDFSEDMEEVEHYQSPLSGNSKVDKQDVKQVAAVARDWLGLSEQNDFLSLRRAVERKGILVVVSNEYPGVWCLPEEQGAVGFVLSYDIVPAIVVRKQASEKRQAFTLMHELGHLLLHSENMLDDEESVNSNRREEKEANEFASCLLVPDEFVDEIDVNALLETKDPAARREFLHEYSNKWCVSIEAILLRLAGEGKIDRRIYAGYKKHVTNVKEVKKTKEQKRKVASEEKPMPRPLSIFGSMYVSIILDSMYSNEMSKSKALTFLDMQLHEMPELEKYKFHA